MSAALIAVVSFRYLSSSTVFLSNARWVTLELVPSTGSSIGAAEHAARTPKRAITKGRRTFLEAIVATRSATCVPLWIRGIFGKSRGERPTPARKWGIQDPRQ